MRYVTTIGDREFIVEIDGNHNVILDGKTFEVDFDSIGDQPVYSMLIDGQSFEAYVYAADNIWQVLLLGRFYPAQVEDERERRLRLAAGSTVSESAEFYLKAPMPGLVIDLPVEEGQQVEKGDVLVILESMKMQNELKSPRPGMVARLDVKIGESVEQSQTLLRVI
jgi:biotin carboxyl carrier protein